MSDIEATHGSEHGAEWRFPGYGTGVGSHAVNEIPRHRVESHIVNTAAQL